MHSSAALVRGGSPASVRAALGEEIEGWLTPLERSRAEQFRFGEDRESFVVAHALVRACAAELLGSDLTRSDPDPLSPDPLSPDRFTVTQRCTTCGGPHGRPRLLEAPEVCVSLSHTRGYVVCGAAYDSIGVDVELPTATELDRDLARSVLARTEYETVLADADPLAAFLRAWVRKESLVKVGACSLSDLPEVSARLGESHIDLAGQRWFFTDWGGPPDAFIGCAVTRNPDPVVLLLS